jgi:hypothetical protein
MTIRIICATASFILVAALTVATAIAQEPIDRWYLESVYLAQYGHLTPVQQRGFEDLPPEDQERIIQNYRRYKQLPQNQRKKLQNRYKKWQQMSPEERQELRKTYEKFKRMPSHKRRSLKKGLRKR